MIASSLNLLETEEINPFTTKIDRLETVEMLRLINDEDKKVALAVEKEINHIAQAVDEIVNCLQNGGRLIYMGCGTSGRIGVLDAVECPPTYSTKPGQIIGLICGGNEAIFKAIESAEDDKELGIKDLQNINLCKADLLVCLAASGRTPYVLGGIEYAKEIGAKVVGISCCHGSDVEKHADIAITPLPGPEVIAGSTRLKSGTAQKMVCNMLSTGAMIKLGKVYRNLMVDLNPSNEKLLYRCKAIVCEATGVSMHTAECILKKCDNKPKIAIVMILCDCSCEEAIRRLEKAAGHVSAVVDEIGIRDQNNSSSIGENHDT